MPQALPGPREAAPWKPLEIPPDLSRFGLFVGTSGFHYGDWAGAFYPPPRGSRNGDVYPFYQMYFSFLEVNHTFLREPELAHFAELERRSRPSMRFSVMAHRDVSQKGTWDAAEGRSLMRRHVAAVAPLAESGRFHSFLIQLDHRQERSRKVHDYLLATASAAVEEGLDAHIEFRNRTWHQEAVLRSLQDAGIGVCNPDLPALLPGAFPLRAYATTAKGYLRYSGQNAAAWDDDAARRPAQPSPEGPLRRDSRYDYLYSLEEVEARIPGQFALLRKTGAVAVVYRNHARGRAALNAVQNLFLAEREWKARKEGN
jgi:uncharacterized protein YecE (DUF72 family)